MADLEQRVTDLEREVRALKTTVETSGTRLEAVDKDMQGIPGLIKAEFRFFESRFARVMADMADLRATVDERFQAMDGRFDSLLRAVSEIVAERKAGS